MMQIIHASSWNATSGVITGMKFVDSLASSKRHKLNPAIRQAGVRELEAPPNTVHTPLPGGEKERGAILPDW